MSPEDIKALKDLAELRNSGAITDEEFQHQKALLLKKSASNDEPEPPDEALSDALKIVDARKIIDVWRDERIAERKRFLNRVLKKIKVQEISVTRRVPHQNSYGEDIDISELINRCCEVYRESGYTVEEGDRHVRLRFHGEAANEIGVCVSTIACVIFVRRPKSWQIVVRGEMEYWPKKLERFLTGGCLFIVFTLVFWPCLLCLPFMFDIDEKKMANAAEDQLLSPLRKMMDDFRVEQL